MTPKLVLDTNCIIDLEENRAGAHHVRYLLSAWRHKSIDVAVVAVTASENQPGGRASRDVSAFEAKLNNVGLATAHHLLPLAVWDIFYWDHALWPSPDLEKLQRRIYETLFPGRSPCPTHEPELNSAWRNNLCDVMIVWSCIYHGWGSLVTRDRNFHKHSTDLAALGLQEVLYPADAASHYAYR
jgi:hypothetical protein